MAELLHEPHPVKAERLNAAMPKMGKRVIGGLKRLARQAALGRSILHI